MQQSVHQANSLRRVQIWYACLMVILGVFVVRLFYLQVIRHDYYQQAALRAQLKQYEIEPERGTVVAHNGDSITPIVLNQTLYTLYADPRYVKDPSATAVAIQKVIGGDVTTYLPKLTANSRYEILTKKISKQQKDDIKALKLKGVGARDTIYRTYPQGQLAAQVLGFVNDEGDGQYGLEQALNNQLRGTPGRLRAITDAQGIPLAANKDNIIVNPETGKTVLLTLDIGMQKQLEDILKQQVEETKASQGSALVLDAHNGAVKAMANFPTYDPAEYSKVKDQAVFRNSSVSDAVEVGSIMKPLTMAAALDLGVVNKDSAYFDPNVWVIGDAAVRNVEGYAGQGTRTLADILQLSLNTGATWLLMQMGGGEINEKARVSWYDYLINRYQFSKPTGIEQSNEGSGIVPSPTDGYGLNIQYANSTFGQGQTETLLQMGAAIAAVLNGGTYYQPHLVDAYMRADGTQETQPPKVVKTGVVAPSVSKQIQALMESVVQKNKLIYGVKELRPEYSYGGKTGTAQIPKPTGGYYEDRFNGTFMGFVGGDEPEYVIVIEIREPRNISGFAGAQGAAPVYMRLADMLINNFGVKPRK